MDLISIVVPCYNEEQSIPLFYEEITKEATILKKESVELELVFIDDGSSDKTLSILRSLSVQDSRVHFLSFSRNFGKESAIYAGLEHSNGDYVAVMDVDLQDPPELLIEMYHCLKTGEYDIAATRRVTRKGEPIIRSFFAKAFYRLINKLIDFEIVDGARDYRIMTRTSVNAILSMQEYNRFSKGIFGWIGFKTKWFSYENRQRVAGETKWSFWKLLKYSIEGITAFTTLPLTLALWVGAISCCVSLIALLFIIITTLHTGSAGHGWASLVCLILFFSGVQLFFIGILGEYLSKTYLETKHRPIYLVREESNNRSTH